MKGINEIRVNTATMIEGVQLVINAMLKENAPAVTGVEMGKNLAGDNVFIITLDSAQPPITQPGSM